MPAKFHCLVALLLLGLASTANSAAPEYRATEITAGGSRTWAYGINNRGDVVGQGYTPAELPRAYLFADGVVTVIPTLGGWVNRAQGINDARQVVGSSVTSGDQSEHAFLYYQGALTDLGTLGGPNSHAEAINASGQISGSSILSPSGPEHAFVYGAGSMQDLGTLGGATSLAADINDRGQVAGWSEGSPGTGGGAFLWTGGVMTGLGASFAAFGINASGVIAGFLRVPGTPGAPLGIRAAVYVNGAIREIEFGSTEDSSADDINQTGWMVGSKAGAPVLFADGVAYDLNTLVVAGLNGARLRDARAINHSGQIAANTCEPPNASLTPCSAYRLDPIPDVVPSEIPTLSVLGLSAMVVLLLAFAMGVREA